MSRCTSADVRGRLSTESCGHGRTRTPKYQRPHISGFNIHTSKTSTTWPLCVHNYFTKERYAQRAGETTKLQLAAAMLYHATQRVSILTIE